MMQIYCDGACSGNPGPGGWAYVIFENEKKIASASGGEKYTTNNRMELTAVIKALESFDNCEIILDSKYVKDGITTWILNWKKNGWRSKTGPIKNLDLWQNLDALVQNKNIVWTWQKGHDNSTHDLADELARSAIIHP